MKNNTKPLPCPFCGKLPEVEHWSDLGCKDKVSCYNSECWARPSVSAWIDEEAIERWNIRKGEQ